MFSLRTLGVLMYDALIVSALFFIVTAACLLVRHGAAIAPHTLWYQLILGFVGMAYYLLSYQRGGQTIGMRAWRLKVVSKTKTHLNKRQIIGRFVLALPAIVIALCQLKSPSQILNRWTMSEIIRV